ncbi:hypothetical protein [Ramlibacter alkalitolerans]|uniref:EF-hand domain-containing protein n=1 Tax=Ramlibacter alkalitolerans TaxID=2039631 RepID=A0ABS1JTV8_9BURK|nr:hypothetical protein [Ramlibacter alkalitolerans]MBL0427689.1 hypothetical protein [Ramlibacter alkalitolerans]
MAVVTLPTTAAAKPKRATGKLVLALKKPLPKKSQWHVVSPFTGSIEVKGFRFEDADPILLGLACFVLNASTITLESPTFADGGGKLYASRDLTLEQIHLRNKVDDMQRAEGWFIGIFQNALRTGFDSKRQVKDVLDMWGEQHLPRVLARIPQRLQVNTRFAYGLYDEKGWPMTPFQHQQQVSRQRLLEAFKGAMSGDTPEEREKNLQEFADPEGALSIPWQDITQFLDSANESLSDPVAIGGQAFVALKKLFSRFGIEAMPRTVGELRASVLYCTLLYQATHPLILGAVAANAESAKLGREIAVKGLIRDIPELAPTLQAYQAGDMDRLREIHRTTMTFGEMARHYDADEDGWVTAP